MTFHFSIAPCRMTWLATAAFMLFFNTPLGIGVLEKYVAEMPMSPFMLDLSGIRNGHYFLKMTTPGERAVFGKLLVAGQTHQNC